MKKYNLKHLILTIILCTTVLSNILILNDYLKSKKYKIYYNEKARINMKLLHQSIKSNKEILENIIKNEYFTREEIDKLYEGLYTFKFSQEELYYMTRVLTDSTRQVQTNSPTLNMYYILRNTFSGSRRVRAMLPPFNTNNLHNYSKEIKALIYGRNEDEFSMPSKIFERIKDLNEIHAKYLEIINNYQAIWTNLNNINYIEDDGWTQIFIDIYDEFDPYIDKSLQH